MAVVKISISFVRYNSEVVFWFFRLRSQKQIAILISILYYFVDYRAFGHLEYAMPCVRAQLHYPPVRVKQKSIG